jgi:hypothetical protein
MTVATALALALACLSTILTNLAYQREHDAAAVLPILSMRRPLHSLHLLLADRSWMLGFAMETSGFLLYAVALALAPLALVQSIEAGGIGVLAYVSARIGGRHLSGRELAGALISVFGLTALAGSLAGVSGAGSGGTTAGVLAWLGATAAVAAVMVTVGRRVLGPAVAGGLAGGLLFSIGDISTKLATQGGARIGFVVTLITGYALGTSLLQLGYQAGGALTVAGVATLLTNALPIAAGAIVLGEPVPAGALGVLRVIAFAAVCVGAFLLARADGDPEPRRTAPVAATR